MENLVQPDISSIPERTWHVAIAGGGPAGAICALQLSRAGYRVLVVDKERFPRHKTCGDMLIPDAVAALGRLGLAQPVCNRAAPIPNIKVFSPSRIDFDIPGNYYGIRRIDFDSLLIAAAVEAGASFAHGAVTDIVDHGDRVTFMADGAEVEARIGVLATGANVDLSSRLGLTARPQPSAVALRHYVRSDYPLTATILSYDRPLMPGYAWIIPLGDGLFNVGCGCRLGGSDGAGASLKRHLREFLADFPIARDLMARGEAVSKISGAALRCGLEGNARLAVGRLVAIGETIGATFPFTGEGIGKAIHSAEIAAQVIGRALEHDNPSLLAEYARRVENELRPYYHGYFVAERWLSRPWLTDFLARRTRRSQYLRGELRDFVAESGDPRRLFSLRSVLRSYWK